MTPLCHLLQEMPSAFCSGRQAELIIPVWGAHTRMGLYYKDRWPPFSRNLHSNQSVEMHVFYSSGRLSTDKSKCFPSHRKNYRPQWERFHPTDMGFLFFQES